MATHTESLPSCQARVVWQGDVESGSAGSTLACPARQVEHGEVDPHNSGSVQPIATSGVGSSGSGGGAAGSSSDAASGVDADVGGVREGQPSSSNSSDSGEAVPHAAEA